jgi:hypothetical protein
MLYIMFKLLLAIPSFANVNTQDNLHYRFPSLPFKLSFLKKKKYKP